MCVNVRPCVRQVMREIDWLREHLRRHSGFQAKGLRRKEQKEVYSIAPSSNPGPDGGGALFFPWCLVIKGLNLLRYHGNSKGEINILRER